MKIEKGMAQLNIGDKFLAKCSYSSRYTESGHVSTFIEKRVVMDFSKNKKMVKLRPDYWIGSWFSGLFAEWLNVDASYITFLDKCNNES